MGAYGSERTRCPTQHFGMAFGETSNPKTEDRLDAAERAATGLGRAEETRLGEMTDDGDPYERLNPPVLTARDLFGRALLAVDASTR
jgi:hypothetical protein